MTPLIPIIAVTLLGVCVLLVAGLLLFTYQMARRLLRPERRPMALSPADVNLEMSVIRIPSSRGALAAWYLPASNGCTLVCCHGINDNSGQWLPQIARLHARGGYGALLFDFAGHGQSEGSQVTYGIRERHDVTAAIEYLRQRGDVDMDRVAILGYSLGAITAVLAAVEHPDRRRHEGATADRAARHFIARTPMPPSAGTLPAIARRRVTRTARSSRHPRPHRAARPPTGSRC